jgi:hypothetical protein
MKSNLIHAVAAAVLAAVVAATAADAQGLLNRRPRRF